MNVFFIGMLVAMIFFIAIGIAVSKKVRNLNDFYVAGRNAPVLLIAGSLIASYSSTGMFMGDAATCYDGAFAAIVLFAGMQSAGYMFGAVFFGRYLRRSSALTMPEFFGWRFDSKAIRSLSAITAMITMTVYLLSVIMGIGTLMEVVTGVDYRICVALAAVVFTLISVLSGSKGVLITDTLMAAIFTVAMLIGVGFIAKNVGGLYTSLSSIASDPETSAILSWAGKPRVLGSLYKGGWDNVAWGLIYGVVWMSVCMVSPWQASRYQMARSEHVVIKSSYWSAVGVFVLEFICGIAAVMVRKVCPNMSSSSHVLLWASMNLMPKMLGVILLAGILAAGISSATTFQSLIGAFVANDILKVVGSSSEKTAINSGRVTMIFVSVIVVAIAMINPPAIFIIMYLGGAMMACSWMPVAVASVFSKRVTKTGAFCGMLSGFIGAFGLKLASFFLGFSLPVYLDPSLVGIVVNVVAMLLGTALTSVSDEEKERHEKLFVIPESERVVSDVRRTLNFARAGMYIGGGIFVLMLLMWIIPYWIGIGKW